MFHKSSFALFSHRFCLFLVHLLALSTTSACLTQAKWRHSGKRVVKKTLSRLVSHFDANQHVKLGFPNSFSRYRNEAWTWITSGQRQSDSGTRNGTGLSFCHQSDCRAAVKDSELTALQQHENPEKPQAFFKNCGEAEEVLCRCYLNSWLTLDIWLKELQNRQQRNISTHLLHSLTHMMDELFI